jgi:hypothetical protein
MRARAVNAAIGLWLFWSAFLWMHSPFQAINAWMVGAAAVTAAVAGATGNRGARYVNAVLGAWLIISALLPVGQRPATVWNHIIAGFLLAFFALMRDVRQIKEHPGHA